MEENPQARGTLSRLYWLADVSQGAEEPRWALRTWDVKEQRVRTISDHVVAPDGVYGQALRRVSADGRLVLYVSYTSRDGQAVPALTVFDYDSQTEHVLAHIHDVQGEGGYTVAGLPAVSYRVETDAGEPEQRLWYADTGATVTLATGQTRAGMLGVVDEGRSAYVSREIDDTGEEALFRMRLPSLSFEQVGPAYAEVAGCPGGLSPDGKRLLYTARMADQEWNWLILRDLQSGEAVEVLEERSGNCSNIRTSESFDRGYAYALGGELVVWNGTEVARPFGTAKVGRVFVSSDWKYMLAELPDEGRLAHYNVATGEVKMLLDEVDGLRAEFGRPPSSHAFVATGASAECFESCRQGDCREIRPKSVYAIRGVWSSAPRVELLDSRSTGLEYADENRVLLKSASTAEGEPSETVETLWLYEW